MKHYLLVTNFVCVELAISEDIIINQTTLGAPMSQLITKPLRSLLRLRRLWNLIISYLGVGAVIF